MESISLQPVTRDNWKAVAAIKLPPEQVQFVAPNVDSIAESKFEPHFFPRAIYDGDDVVGFLMYCPENDPPDPELFWFFRFVIKPELQQRGIGRQALKLAIEEMRLAGAARIRTMHKPINQIAGRLYTDAGFQKIGVLDDGDIEYELMLR